MHRSTSLLGYALNNAKDLPTGRSRELCFRNDYGYVANNMKQEFCEHLYQDFFSITPNYFTLNKQMMLCRNPSWCYCPIKC